MAEHQRARRAEKPEQDAERARARYSENPAKHKAKTRAQREANPAKAKELVQAWRKANPDKMLAHKHRRRARLLDSCSPGVTPAQWAEIVECFGGRCAYCLRAGLPLERDHVIPLSRGGLDEPGNVVPACERCNCSKNAAILPVWYARQLKENRA